MHVTCKIYVDDPSSMEQFTAVSLHSMLDSKILPSRVQLSTIYLQDCWRKEASQCLFDNTEPSMFTCRMSTDIFSPLPMAPHD